MKIFRRKKTILVAVSFVSVLVIQGFAAPQDLPNPVLAFTRQENIEVDGKPVIRYKYEVANRSKYPEEMFAPAPNLPPCGSNTKSARTWIDIYDQRGKKLNSFCSIAKTADLDKLWFNLAADVVPPSWVYIEFTDRQTSTKYKSNLAETTQ
jgi:hypothetical protein